MRLGVDIRMGQQRDMCLKEGGLHVQNTSTILKFNGHHDLFYFFWGGG